MMKKLALSGLVLSSMTAMVPTSADAATLFAGTLTCRGQGSIGLILGSRQRLNCMFERKGGRPQSYSGVITRVGIDLGIKGKNVMIWTVLASTDRLPAGALAGKYAGVSANASVGVGVGANALVGGSKNSIVLQPLSVQAQTGLNIAAGVAGFRLTYNPR